VLKALRLGFWIVVALCCASSCILSLWLILRGGAGHTTVFHRHGSAVPVTVDYKDFVSILLTALGVMIGLGSIGVAAVAVFGYAEGRKMVEGIVRQAVNDQLQPAIFRAREDAAAAQSPSVEGNSIAHQAGGRHEV